MGHGRQISRESGQQPSRKHTENSRPKVPSSTTTGRREFIVLRSRSPTPPRGSKASIRLRGERSPCNAPPRCMREDDEAQRWLWASAEPRAFQIRKSGCGKFPRLRLCIFLPMNPEPNLSAVAPTTLCAPRRVLPGPLPSNQQQKEGGQFPPNAIDTGGSTSCVPFPAFSEKVATARSRLRRHLVPTRDVDD